MNFEVIDLQGKTIGHWDGDSIMELLRFIQDYEDRRAYYKAASRYFEHTKETYRETYFLTEIDIAKLLETLDEKLLLHAFDYQIKACDSKGFCLVGNYPYRVEHRDSILAHFG